MKFLIDTNIFIPLEPTTLSDVELGTRKIVILCGGRSFLLPPCREDAVRRKLLTAREFPILVSSAHPTQLLVRKTYDLKNSLNQSQVHSHLWEVFPLPVSHPL